MSRDVISGAAKGSRFLLLKVSVMTRVGCDVIYLGCDVSGVCWELGLLLV